MLADARRDVAEFADQHVGPDRAARSWRRSRGSSSLTPRRPTRPAARPRAARVPRVAHRRMAVADVQGARPGDDVLRARVARGHDEVEAVEVERLERQVHQRQQLRVVDARARDPVEERRVHRAVAERVAPRLGVVDRGEDLGVRQQRRQLQDDLLGPAGDGEPLMDDRRAGKRWREGRALQRHTPLRSDRVDRHHEDLQVERRRPVLDVVVVPLDAVGERGLAAQAADLRPAGDAGLDAMAVGVARQVAPEQRRELGALRARADQAHLAAEHVDELRQLVQRRAAQEAPDARAAVLALDAAGRRAGPGRHGSSAGARHIERNLSMSNTWPSRPTRRWRKRTGPGEVSFTASATASRAAPARAVRAARAGGRART